MKDIGQMSIWEIQKQMDDSLFSDIAWMPSQIHLREYLRGELNDRRTGKGVASIGSMERPIRGDRRLNELRNEKVGIL